MKKYMNLKKYILLVLSCFMVHAVSSQVDKEHEKLSKAEIRSTIDSIGKKLKDIYVFKENGEKISDYLEKNLEAGYYNKFNKPKDLAIELTQQLQELSSDKHLSVTYAPQYFSEQKQILTERDSLENVKRYIHSLESDNYGFKEIKILENNIGYLNLTSFSDIRYAANTAVAAMNFLSNSNALIIDLRRNGGGSPAMVQLLSSYLFDETPVHLNSFYSRLSNSTSQSWTLPYVSGKRNPNIPVYILTSNYTFSAAEEFSYNLKHLNRAIVVGETTGGGANPGGFFNVANKFRVFIPTGRSINPITNKNWEAIGVKADIDVKAENALEVAKTDALKKIIAKQINRKNKS